MLFGILSFFFPKSCLKVGGAAYSPVRLMHESSWYYEVANPGVKVNQNIPNYNFG